MSYLKIDESIFIDLIKSIKYLIRKINELIVTYKKNNPAENFHKEWLDSADVCSMLNISLRTLNKYKENNILPSSKLAGKVYYHIKDIKKILDNNYS
jgi:hypothetical protein